MPGKYIEFIKAGRYAVPVELTFLPATIIEPDGKEVTTSKWMERRHWKETKAMLKPAVESALKHSEMTILRVNNTHIVTFGEEICLGYMLQATKDNAPFLAVLDAKKNCWTDDEDESLGYSSLSDYGGRFKNYAPTKVHIIACVMKKTLSNSEDNRRLRKELGVRSDDLRNYFQQATTNVNNPGPSTSSSFNCFNQGGLGFSESSADKTSCNHLLSTFDAYCAKANMKKARYSRKNKDFSKACTTTPAWKSTIPSPRRQEAFWNRPYRDAKFNGDTLDSDDASSDGSSDASTDSNVFEKRVSSGTNDADDDDDDDFSLPDIDSPIKPVPVKKPRVYKRKNVLSTITPKRSVNTYQKDVFASSDSSSASKTPRKKKQAPINYFGFGGSHSQTFEEAIGATSYHSPVTKKAKTNALAYSKPKVSKKVPKPNATAVVRPQNTNISKSTSTITSPVKKNSNSFNEFSFQSLTSQEYRKVSNTSIGDSSFRDGSFFYPSKHPDNNSFMNKDFSSSVKTPSPTTSSPSGEETSARNFILGSDRILTVAAKKSFGEPESAEEDKQRKRKSSTSDMATNGSVSKPKKHKNKDKDRSLESPHKSTSEGRSKESRNASVNGVPYDPEMPVIDKMVDDGVPDEQQNNVPPRLSNSHSKASSSNRRSEVSTQKISTQASFMYSPVSQSTTVSPTKTPVQAAISIEGETPTKSKKKKHKDKTKKRRKTDTAEIGVHSDDVAPKLVKKTDLPLEIISNSKDDISATSSSKSSNPIVGENAMERYKHLKSINSQLVKHKDACTSTTADAKLDEVVNELLRQNAVINYEVDVSDSEETRENDTTIFMTEYDDETGEEQVRSVVQVNSQKRHPSTEYSDDDEDFFAKNIVPLCASQSVERSFHMPAFGPTDEYADRDLFCFNKSSSDRTQSSYSLPMVSNNKVSQATNTDDEEAISMPPPTKRPPRSPKKPIPSSLNRPVEHTTISKINDNLTVSVSSKSPENPKQLSTYHLLSHPTVFATGMDYLQKLSTSNITAKEITDKLGIATSEANTVSTDKTLMPPPCAPKPKRDLSPDICCLTPDTKINQIRKSVRQSRARTRRRIDTGSTDDEGLEGELTPKVEAESDVEDSAGQELVRELMRRCTTNFEDPLDSGDDRNDNLSQRSACMTNFVPGYVQKSVIYKKHSKLIQAMSLAELVEHFDAIRPEIRGIYEGVVSSTRHCLYLQGLSKKKFLKELNISIPFTSQQGMCLISFLYDFLFPDPDERLQFTEYITYVMLPEAYIRIYARATDQTYDMAQLEMRFGACYDESPAEES